MVIHMGTGRPQFREDEGRPFALREIEGWTGRAQPASGVAP